MYREGRLHIYYCFLSASPTYLSVILIYFDLNQAKITFCPIGSYILRERRHLGQFYCMCPVLKGGS